MCARSLIGKLLLLGLQLLRPCSGSVPFTETFPAPAIAALDKARSQVVATAVAADQPLSFRLARRFFVERLTRFNVRRPSLLWKISVRAGEMLVTPCPCRGATDRRGSCQFCAFHSHFVSSAITAGRGCLLCGTHEASAALDFVRRAQAIVAIGRRMGAKTPGLASQANQSNVWDCPRWRAGKI